MRYLTTTLLSLIPSLVFSQSLISSGGNSGNQVSFSIGEVFIGEGNNGSTQITQGFQQPNLWGVKIQEQDLFEILVYPNPVKDFLTLELQQEFKEAYTLQLYSSGGQWIFSRQMDSTSELLDFSSFAAGSYTLIVNNLEGQVASFRIVKTK